MSEPIDDPDVIADTVKTSYGLLFKKGPYWIGVWNDKKIAEDMHKKYAARGDVTKVVEFTYFEDAQ